MKISVYWIPVFFWVLMVMVYNGAIVGNLLVEYGATNTTTWVYRILGAYSILFSSIYFCYHVLISNLWEINTEVVEGEGCGKRITVGWNKKLDCPINNQCGMTKEYGKIVLCEECKSVARGGKDE
jgi:hypothetical protein|tara:strand:- start:211 stop:585 length:375 start_codon:yes stop_codon:yes gene_type:complete